MGVIPVFRGWSVERDDRGGEFHLRIIPAELDGLIHKRVAIEPLRWIWGVFVDPMKLVQGFDEITQVEESEGSGRCILGGGVRTRYQLDEEMFRGEGIQLEVEGGTAKSFHVDEDGGVSVQNGDGVRDEIFDVVRFAAGEIPVMVDPREGFGVADVEGVTEQRRTCEGGICGEE